MNTKNRSDSKTLGILGGLGPMSSVYFYELLTSHTDAVCDQDHIDILLSSRATTPDRTAFITGKSSDNPLPVMKAEAKRLSAAGADIIAMPCNTAHYFYRSLISALSIPLLNIIELTVKYAKFSGASSVGVMATAGTVGSGGYLAACLEAGIDCVYPRGEDQLLLNDIIYGSVKRGTKPDISTFLGVSERLASSCQGRIILGCTELSLIKRNQALSDMFIDSLDVLAACAIACCGKGIRSFPPSLSDFARRQAAQN